MKRKIKVCEIGYSLDTFKRMISAGIMSSHLLYGAYQLEKDNEIEISYYCLRGSFIKHIWSLVHMDADIIFIPYIYIDKLFYIIMLLKAMHIVNQRYIGILHRLQKKPNALHRFLFMHFDWLFFHSALNMDEAIKNGLSRIKSSSVLPWGMDLTDYPQSTITSDYFISSGMENRDYEILLKALRLQQLPFKLFMPEQHAEAYPVYEGLTKLNNPKIETELVTQSEDTIKKLSHEVKNAFAVVIPIRKDSLNYCVGHTSMVEACALGKAIIVTDNPYHPIDVEKENIGIKFKAGNAESLQQALKKMQNDPNTTVKMGHRARELAEKTYNIENCAKHLKSVCLMLVQQ